MTDINYGSLESSGSSYGIYSNKFDKSLLKSIPRRVIRDLWKIDHLVFTGYDVWTCHEATFLTNSGRPVAGTLRFMYSSDTPNIVESKSMKLYLDSFDMCNMGYDIDDAIISYCDQIRNDLSEIVQGEVHSRFFSSNDYLFNGQEEYPYSMERDPLSDYDSIESLFGYELDRTFFTDYTAEKKHITLRKTGAPILKVYTNALRSRCRHTNQKNTGTAAFSHLNLTGTSFDIISLFKQVVSLREVNEFNEGCAEKLFKDLYDSLENTDPILVGLLYSRRGSLDISPIRMTKNYIDFQDEDSMLSMLDMNIIPVKAQGQ